VVLVLASLALAQASVQLQLGGFRGARVAAFRGARRGWGWGWPVAFGLGLGAAYGYPYYSDACIVWDGYAWVNVCYPYPYY
jgi:hypothetical protein